MKPSVLPSQAGSHETISWQSSPRLLLATVYFIYFFCGLTQCFESVFLPEFKEYFHLNYQQQMYTMFAKNIPFLLAAAIGYAIRYTGYKNCMTVAMALFAAGTLLLIPGLRSGSYALVLLGFFLIGLGFNCEIVAGNPMLSALGPVQEGSSRLNLGNALGAVAQIIAPAALSIIIPASVVTAQARLPYMEGLFLVLGAVLAVVSVVTLLLRDVDVRRSFQIAAVQARGRWFPPGVLMGFVAIFLTLGVEAGLFGFFRNFAEDPAIAGFTARQSQMAFTLYLAVFALGRLLASRLQRRMDPVVHLLIYLAGAVLCLLVMILAKGVWAVAALMALGFFVSIFFPTLYALAIENQGERTGQISGLLTMGFVGCSVIPVVQGKLADSIGLQYSYVLGFGAYGFAAVHALRLLGQRRSRRTEVTA
ncbi:MAG: MFS transporter [Acidobacteriia bacterium]|nr:MFS transporter [Terriglobia bacterium]